MNTLGRVIETAKVTQGMCKQDAVNALMQPIVIDALQQRGDIMASRGSVPGRVRLSQEILDAVKRISGEDLTIMLGMSVESGHECVGFHCLVMP